MVVALRTVTHAHPPVHSIHRDRKLKKKQISADRFLVFLVVDPHLGVRTVQ